MAGFKVESRPGETASQMAERYMEIISDAQIGHYTKGEIRSLLNNISQAGDRTAPIIREANDAIGSRGPVTVTDMRRGDVFIAKTVGGKTRPWVVLRVTGDLVWAIAMSSADHTGEGIASRCRFWPGSVLSQTVSCFTIDVACQEVTRPYTNKETLRDAEKSMIDALLGRKRPRKQD